MADKIVKVYMSYDAETDKLEILIKDRTNPCETFLSTENVSIEDMKPAIGNLIIDIAENMMEDEKRFLKNN